MSALVRCLICCLLGVMLSASSPAHADADPAKEARALFEHGLQQADATHWPQAAELFQQALALRDSPVIRFNLSSALAELGKLTEALALLEALEQDTRTSRELLPRVQADRVRIEQRLGKLTLRVNTDAPAWRLLLDERELPREQIGVPLKVDPKLHYVSLRAGERVLDDAQLELAEGETRELTLAGNVPPPVVARKAPAPLELTLVGFGPRHDDTTSKRKRRVIWGVSVAAAAVAAGVVAGVMLAKRDEGGGATSADAFTPGRVGVRVPQ
jgi:hypothetical protein